MSISTDDALQIMDQAYKDILVQAGKHVKVIARDGPGALVGTHSAIRAKTADSLTQYHLALNEIESEIIRAKSVLLRDLEKLRAARIPAPVAVPTPQPVAPPAPMMELPSAAAHSRNLNVVTYPSSKESKTVAPFPDMGMGMSSDVVDLTGAEKKPSPRIQAGSFKPGTRPGPPTGVKPPAKPSPKPTPPAKVTPVPPPQIPRLQAFQASTQPKSQVAAQPPRAAQSILPPQQSAAARTAQENTMDSMLGPPSTGPGDGPTAGSGNGEMHFTDMQFSLAPSLSESQGAPPAPMPEFDLATFAPQGGNNNNAAATAGITASSNSVEPPNADPTPNPKSSMDEIFNLDDSNGGSDSMFDLGGGEVNDSTFDDMMFFGNNDSDMAQFDDAYFGL